jgi:hypothetical protein
VDLSSYIRRLDHMYELGGNFARKTGPEVDWAQTSTVAGSGLGTCQSAGGLPMDGLPGTDKTNWAGQEDNDVKGDLKG